MNEATKEIYCMVVYTDGDKFISPRGFGRLNTVVSLPKAKYNQADKDPKALQAALALFNQTAIRVLPTELESLGIFSSDENFDMDVYYIKVTELPLIDKLKSNEYFSTIGDKRISAFDGYNYIKFSDIDDPKYIYSFKGMKNVLWQINEHFENEVPWADIV